MTPAKKSFFTSCWGHKAPAPRGRLEQNGSALRVGASGGAQGMRGLPRSQASLSTLCTGSSDAALRDEGDYSASARKLGLTPSPRGQGARNRWSPPARAESQALVYHHS